MELSVSKIFWVRVFRLMYVPRKLASRQITEDILMVVSKICSFYLGTSGKMIQFDQQLDDPSTNVVGIALFYFKLAQFFC